MRPLAAAATAALTAVAYGVLVERRWFRVRRVDVPGVLSRHATGPMTIVVVADLHLARHDPGMARVVARAVAEHDPDLVVAAGDLCGGPDARDAVLSTLRPLVAGGRPGVAVLGSNDRYGPGRKHPLVYFTDPDARVLGPPLDADALVGGLARDGWRVLRGERTLVPTRAGAVAVAGLEDPHLPEPAPPHVDELRLADEVALRLGVVHAPYTAAVDLLVDAGADLVVAGHTHGGQVRLPGIGALTANCDLPLDRARGLSRWRRSWLHVTPGLGQSVWAPFRFGCRPEVSVLRCT